MQATVIDAEIEQELEPQIRLWSIADYHQMIEAGILGEDDRVELLEGKIVCMSPQRPFHAASVQRSSRLLFKLLSDRAEIRIQLPVILGNDSEPEPDIAIVKFDANEYSFRHPEVPDIYLLIEVADSTIAKDRKQKACIYAKNRVLEYWILDLQKRQVYVFRQPEEGSYREELILSSNDSIAMQAFPDAAIALDAMFPIAQNQLNISMVAPWVGELELEFTKRNQQTLLTRSYTVAPWKIQRSLYPEGEEVCHCILLHTAGGLVGGDRLSAKIHLQPHTQALITTATASKIYRSNGAESLQNIHIRIEEGANLEWLPQETIAFAESQYRQTTRIELEKDATLTMWEIVRFGRTARGEKFIDGNWRSHTEVWRDQSPLWIDRQYLNGNSEMLGSPNGLNNYAIAASFVFVGAQVEPELINQIRSTWNDGNFEGTSGVTRSLSGLVCRYCGNSSSDARKWFQQIWQLLRVSYRDRPICVPRVW